MPYRSAHWAVLGGLIAASPLIGRDLSGLTRKNPFAEAGKEVAAKPAEAPPPVQLELRGVVREKSGYLLNIFDTQTQKSHWVVSGDKIKDLMVAGYDSVSETLRLDSGGQGLILALKTAKSRDQVRGPVALTSTALAQIQVKIQKTAMPPEMEVRRMEELAQVIGHRRERREKKT